MCTNNLNYLEEEKGCMCSDHKHDKGWHCIAHKAGAYLVADFPFNNPPSHDTGLWSKKEFHKIEGWGKKWNRTASHICPETVNKIKIHIVNGVCKKCKKKIPKKDILWV